jgi:hypothetical protein
MSPAATRPNHSDGTDVWLNKEGGGAGAEPAEGPAGSVTMAGFRERGDAMACPSCGSWAVKADRALAGRMVCARCGQPLGLGVPAAAGRRRRRRSNLVLPRHWRAWLGVTGVVGVSALLAAQTPSPVERLPLPPTLRDSPSGLGRPAKPGGLGM